MTLDECAIIKIRENPISQIEINQNYSHVKLKLNKESEVVVNFSSPSILKIRCDIALTPNTWAKLLQYSTWQEVLDRYDTWGDLLNSVS